MSLKGIENGKEVLYVSYPCVDDGETDFLEIDEIKNIKIDSYDFTCINPKTALAFDEMVKFRLEYNDGKELLLTATSEDICLSEKLREEEFIDDFADSIYTDSDFNISEIMTREKDVLISQIKDKLFKEKGIMEIGSIYKNPIKIYNPDNKLIGIGQQLQITKTGVEVEYIVSLVPLSEFELNKIEIINQNNKIALTRVSNVLLEENVFKNASFEYKGIEVISVEEIDPVCFENFTMRYEIALEAYSKYLPKLSDLISSNSNEEDFDFDFDF